MRLKMQKLDGIAHDRISWNRAFVSIQRSNEKSQAENFGADARGARAR